MAGLIYPQHFTERNLPVLTISSVDIARRAFHKHRAVHSLAHYTGILSMHAYARLAHITADPAMLAEIRAILLDFMARGEDFMDRSKRGRGSFSNYNCGGNATAFLYYLGHLPEAEATLRHYAEDTLHNARRDKDGIVSFPWREDPNLIWIDAAFGVTPFMLFCGLALNEEAWIEDAFQQTRKMFAVLRNPDNGLLHQARGFTAPGKVTEDHWSRGNGWGALAIAELVNYLPPGDPRRPEAESIFAEFCRACLQHQNEQGLWHQEMTNQQRSYVETSGSGLMLYMLGVGLEKGLLSTEARTAFEAGLRGFLDYIRADGSVYHTCRGNLSPGQGTMLDYRASPPVLNDNHAFGPVTLAFGQAARLGLHELTMPTL